MSLAMSVRCYEGDDRVSLMPCKEQTLTATWPKLHEQPEETSAEMISIFKDVDADDSGV